MTNKNILKIGEVVSIDGRTIKIKVFKTKNSSNLFYKGKIIKNVGVGSYVKIIKGFTKIVAKVDGEYIQEDKQAKDKEYKNIMETIDRYIIVKLLGFFDKKNEFVKGIKEMPLIFNECFLLTKNEFEKIHMFVEKNDVPLKIGTLSLEKEEDLCIGINALFASHFGIFGNTGSGKSYTLASIYRKLFLKYKNNEKFKNNSRFFLLDFNGEYSEKDVIIDNEYKQIFKLSTRVSKGDKYPIEMDSINNVDFWAIFLTATEKTQKPFIKRTLSKYNVDEFKIENLIERIIKNENKILFSFFESIESFLKKNINIRKLRNKIFYNSTISKFYYHDGNKTCYQDDTKLDEFLKYIKKSIDYSENDGYKIKDDLTDIDIIHLKFIFYYYDEIISGFSNQEHLAPLINRLRKRIEDLKKVIKVKKLKEKTDKFLTIVSLKDVSLDMKKTLPLLMCKELYENKKEEKQSSKKYLNIIIDEAHNILSYESQRESALWKDYRLETFEEIIKEGRKFGVFLTIASQRPADISSTIVSQLHNYFLHRLINEKDVQAVEKTISYLDKVSLEYLSILPTGTCIFAGIALNMPIIVNIDKIDSKFEPRNETIKLTKIWGDLDA